MRVASYEMLWGKARQELKIRLIDSSGCAMHPVATAGFLAKVERGTRFEWEKMPVDRGSRSILP